MKVVYVVESSYDYEGGEVEGVFDSLKKAQQLQDHLMKEKKKSYYDKEEEIEKWSSDKKHWSMKLGDYCVVITLMEVK